MYPHHAGQAPYQQPYGNGYAAAAYPPIPQAYGQQPYQQPYGQPAYQPGYQPGYQPPANSYQNGPPNKKQKSGGTVVTRYPPPPGYQPPAQSAFPGYQPPVPAYGVPPFPTPGYPPPPFQQPQGYQAPPYPPHPGFTPHHAYGQSQSYQQPPYQPPQPYVVPPPLPIPPPSQTPSQAWPAAPPLPFGPAKPPNLSQQRSLSGPLPIPEQSIASADDGSVDYGFDLDFESEAPFSKDPENIQPEFSLGIVIWTAPLLVRTVLPATFAEAELEALAPSKPREGEDESISQYHIKSRAHEVGLCVKQTEEWESIQDDLIFVEFTSHCEFVPVQQVVANRDRHDATPEDEMVVDHQVKDEPVVTTEYPMDQALQKVDEVEEEDVADGDQAMDLNSDDEGSMPPEVARPTKAEPSNLFDNLEQALGTNSKRASVPVLRPFRNGGHDRSKSRSFSPDRSYGQRYRSPQRSPQRGPSLPPVVPPPKNPAQESMLAALGVEGSPKVVFPTPGPALGPLPQADRGAPLPHASLSRSNSTTNGFPGSYSAQRNPPHNHTTFHPGHLPPPPPPGRQRSPSYDPWKKHDATSHIMFDGGSPKSTTSQHTAVGSDFHADDDDNEATPRARPPLERSASSRKRSYDQVAEPEKEGRRRQYDDVTPRTHRNRPPVAAAYGRR